MEKTIITDVTSIHDFQMYTEYDPEETFNKQLARAELSREFAEFTEGATIGLDKVRIFYSCVSLSKKYRYYFIAVLALAK